MANTILERIQERYPGKADDARNIAEAVGMVYGTGGRGSGAIKDVLCQDYTLTFEPNGGEGEVFKLSWPCGARPDFPTCTFTPPEGKAFKEWNLAADGSGIGRQPGRASGGMSDDLTFYAIWEDAE